VIACRSQVSSNSTSSISTVDITIQETVPIQGIGTHIRKWYRYRGSVRIQENDTNTGDWYEYKKMILIQGSVRIQENDTDIGDQYECMKMVQLGK